MKIVLTLALTLATLAVLTGVGVAQERGGENHPAPMPTFPENPLPTASVSPATGRTPANARPLSIAKTLDAMEQAGRKPVAFGIGGVVHDMRAITTDAEMRIALNDMQEGVNRLAPGSVVIVWEEEDPPQVRWPWGFAYELLPADDNCLIQIDAPDPGLPSMCFPSN